jgi:hypothetical protein
MNLSVAKNSVQDVVEWQKIHKDHSELMMSSQELQRISARIAQPVPDPRE